MCHIMSCHACDICVSFHRYHKRSVSLFTPLFNTCVISCLAMRLRLLSTSLLTSYIFLQLCVSYSSMCLMSCLFISSYIGLFSYYMSSMLVSFHTCRLLLRPTRLVQQEACRASYCQIKFLYFSQFQWVCRSGCCLSKSQLDCISSFFRPGMHGSVMRAVS